MSNGLAELHDILNTQLFNQTEYERLAKAYLVSAPATSPVDPSLTRVALQGRWHMEGYQSGQLDLSTIQVDYERQKLSLYDVHGSGPTKEISESLRTRPTSKAQLDADVQNLRAVLALRLSVPTLDVESEVTDHPEGKAVTYRFKESLRKTSHYRIDYSVPSQTFIFTMDVSVKLANWRAFYPFAFPESLYTDGKVYPAQFPIAYAGSGTRLRAIFDNNTPFKVDMSRMCAGGIILEADTLEAQLYDVLLDAFRHYYSEQLPTYRGIDFSKIYREVRKAPYTLESQWVDTSTSLQSRGGVQHRLYRVNYTGNLSSNFSSGRVFTRNDEWTQNSVFQDGPAVVREVAAIPRGVATSTVVEKPATYAPKESHYSDRLMDKANDTLFYLRYPDDAPTGLKPLELYSRGYLDPSYFVEGINPYWFLLHYFNTATSVRTVLHTETRYDGKTVDYVRYHPNLPATVPNHEVWDLIRVFTPYLARSGEEYGVVFEEVH